MINQYVSNTYKKSAYSLSAILFAFTLVNANLAVAEESVTLSIPTMSDARIFAEFKDKMPAVVNYFSKSTEEEIIAFYQKEYGLPLAQERKRGRLTLTFNQEMQNIRVVISHQNNLRQVDVIVEKITSK
ncbi:MAG: hypothetical protein QMC62_12145 [Alteromonadaceae bacterium]|jgi:hypothetical protein